MRWTFTAVVISSVLPALSAAIDHAMFNQLLRAHVRNGLVDYQGFQQDGSAFDNYLSELKGAKLDRLSKPEKLAFWINAYNALVIKGVLNHGPLKSVQDVRGFFDKITYRAAGESMTLNDIERQALALGDPRVHFALVCASSSCPVLRAEAYEAGRLDRQLNDQARDFLADPDRGLRLDEARGIAHLSRIFKWYARDFTGRGPLGSLFGSNEDILKALTPYVEETARKKIQGRSWNVEFMPYDWGLNQH